MIWHRTIRRIVSDVNLNFAPRRVPGRCILQSLRKIPMNGVHYLGVLIKNRRHRLILGVILVGDLQGGGLKSELGLVIDLGTQVRASFRVLADGEIVIHR